MIDIKLFVVLTLSTVKKTGSKMCKNPFSVDASLYDSKATVLCFSKS